MTRSNYNNFTADGYHSFSGVDIIPSITIPGDKTYVFGEIQTISYSIHREKHPVRACGFINPKGFTRGPRTIAGSLIFTVFDRHMMEHIIDKRRELMGHEGKIITDELPLFNITITLGNEYNAASRLAIYDVTITDEGQVMSVDDMLTEQTMTYIARDIDLMSPELRPYKHKSSQNKGLKKSISGGGKSVFSNVTTTL